MGLFWIRGDNGMSELSKEENDILKLILLDHYTKEDRCFLCGTSTQTEERRGLCDKCFDRERDYETDRQTSVE